MKIGRTEGYAYIKVLNNFFFNNYFLLQLLHISRKENILTLWFCYLLVYLPVYFYKQTKEDKQGSNNEYEICPEERFFQNSIGDHLKWIRIQNMVYSCFSFAFHLSCVVPIALHFMIHTYTKGNS